MNTEAAQERLPQVDDVVARIDGDGFCVIPGFVPAATLRQFMPEVYARFARQSFNGTIGYVDFGRYRYLQHTLTVHPEILKIYTHPFVIACCERYMDERVHVGDYRIYQNLPGGRMSWHVDNNVALPETAAQIVHYRGVNLLVYLEDVDHGPFEFVRGSHRWSGDVEFWEDRIDDHRDEIVAFNHLPAGTAILYDFRGIHRPQPFARGAPRTALFCQYAGEHQYTGEPILLDAKMLGNLSDEERRILRFGREPSWPTWPMAADAPQRAVGVPRVPGAHPLLSLVGKVFGVLERLARRR